jgi:hypothetical protein
MKVAVDYRMDITLITSYEAAICSIEIFSFETVLQLLQTSCDSAQVCCQSQALYRFAVV